MQPGRAIDARRACRHTLPVRLANRVRSLAPFLLLGLFRFIVPGAVFAVEPLPITVEVQAAPGATVARAVVTNVRAALNAALTDLPRYRTVSEPHAHRLSVEVLSFAEERVWIPRETDSDDDDDDDEGRSDGLLVRLIETILFSSRKSAEADGDGEWQYSAQLLVSVQLTPPDAGQTRAALVSVSAQESAPGIARSAIFNRLPAALESELRGLYRLRATARSVDTRLVEIAVGETLGVTDGMLFAIRSGADGGQLARITSPTQDRSLARVVRRWGRPAPDGVAEELLSNGTDLRIYFFSDTARKLPGLVADVVFRPYAAFHFGIGAHAFGTEDSYGRVDFGFGAAAFVGTHLVHAPRVRLTATVGGGAGIVFRPDDEDQPASAVVPSAYGSLESSVVLQKHTDLVVGVGYRMTPTVSTWWVPAEKEGAESRRASFEAEAPRVENAGPYLFAGLRFTFL